MLSKTILLILALIWALGQIGLKLLSNTDPAFYFARLARDGGAVSLSLFALLTMTLQIRLFGWRKGLFLYGFLFLFIQALFGTSILLQRSIAVKLREQSKGLEKEFSTSLTKVEKENRPKKETSQMREKLKDLIYEANRTKASWTKTIIDLDKALMLLITLLFGTLVIGIFFPPRYFPNLFHLNQ